MGILFLISDFAPVCQDDLYDVDEVAAAFNADLSLEVQEILATGVAFYWTSARILDATSTGIIQITTFTAAVATYKDAYITVKYTKLAD